MKKSKQHFSESSKALLKAGIFGLSMCLAVPVFAGGELKKAGPGYPYIEGEWTVEFQSDHTFRSDDNANEISDTYNTTELGLGVHFNRYLSAFGTFVLEPVTDPDGDRFFEDHGVYVEELYAQFKLGGVDVSVGKFNPAFGKAWDEAPGIYGTDVAENYELTERVGFSVSTEADKTTLGTLAFTASVYYLDRSELSDSIGTKRGRIRASDGGASNTGELNSVAIAVEGSDVPGLKGVKYNLGYRFQKAGEGGVDDENGFVAGLSGEESLGSVTLEWIGEIAYLDNADGTEESELYYTLGGNFKFSNNYEVALSYTGISRDIGTTDHLFQVSAGTEIFHEWGLSVGYKYHVEEDVDSHTAGIKLEKTFDFTVGK